MVKVSYVLPDGVVQTLELPLGGSVMEGAVKNSLPGIDADCGGACACATCHVKVDAAWRDLVGPAGQMEEEMLDMALDADSSSRLSCQIKITPELDGLVVMLPTTQR